MKMMSLILFLVWVAGMFVGAGVYTYLLKVNPEIEYDPVDHTVVILGCTIFWPVGIIALILTPLIHPFVWLGKYFSAKKKKKDIEKYLGLNYKL